MWLTGLRRFWCIFSWLDSEGVGIWKNIRRRRPPLIRRHRCLGVRWRHGSRHAPRRTCRQNTRRRHRWSQNFGHATNACLKRDRVKIKRIRRISFKRTMLSGHIPRYWVQSCYFNKPGWLLVIIGLILRHSGTRINFDEFDYEWTMNLTGWYVIQICLALDGQSLFHLKSIR